MKAEKIREMSNDEILRKIEDTDEEMLNLRFQHAGGQAQQPLLIKTLRRDRARCMTIMRERSLSAGSATDVEVEAKTAKKRAGIAKPNSKRKA